MIRYFNQSTFLKDKVLLGMKKEKDFMLDIITRRDVLPDKEAWNNSSIAYQKFSTNKKTGDKTLIQSNQNGQAVKQTLTATGVRKVEVVDVPECNDGNERDKRIEELRRMNYTQEEIAVIMGVSQSTVSRIEAKSFSKKSKK